jgi:hypothetical protein
MSRFLTYDADWLASGSLLLPGRAAGGRTTRVRLGYSLQPQLYIIREVVSYLHINSEHF